MMNEESKPWESEPWEWKSWESKPWEWKSWKVMRESRKGCKSHGESWE